MRPACSYSQVQMVIPVVSGDVSLTEMIQRTSVILPRDPTGIEFLHTLST
jgi:hypothetical protein